MRQINILLSVALLVVTLQSCSKTAISDFSIRNSNSSPIVIKYSGIADTVLSTIELPINSDTLLYTLSIEIGEKALDADFEREYIIKITSIADTAGNPITKNVNVKSEWNYVRENNRNVYTLDIDPTDW